MPRFTRNGADLYYELDGSGPFAVYAIGYSGHSNGVIDTAIRQQLSQLFTVLTVDNRGAGQTIVDDKATFTIDDMADDIAAILDHHGARSAHLMGISMGGMIAMTMALRHPDKVRSAVVAVSAAYIDFSGRASFMMETRRELIDRGVPQDLLNRYTAGLFLGDIAFQNEEFIQAWIDAPVDPLAQTQIGAQQQWDAIRHYDIRNQISQIKSPVLVMSSPDDLSIPPQFQDELVEKIPNAEIKRYPGGHLFMAIPGLRPQFFVDTIEFWQKHESSG